MRDWALPLLLLVAGGGAALYWWQMPSHNQSPPTSASPAPQTSAEVVTASSTPSPSPSILYPVPGEEEQTEVKNVPKKALPSLDDSDPSFTQALAELFGQAKLDSFFNLSNLIRRIVVSIDNLPGHKQPTDEFSPLKEMDTPFRVTGKGDQVTLATSNFLRYTPLVHLTQAVDIDQLVAVYVHYYPLFQSAFQELGKPGYFNDRAVHVIEHLLTTPEISAPIQLMRPTKHSRYKFVDDHLESLSAGQKLLIRIGPENARVVEGKLRELLSALKHLPLAHRKLHKERRS